MGFILILQRCGSLIERIPKVCNVHLYMHLYLSYISQEKGPNGPPQILMSFEYVVF